ncbi:aspartyl/asparaginyl beta-hydroxylase isoform X2 [Trichoplusia ni]|uniref:Aspartyl/asparaginyl beta-hydroxylase isoform X2 n=1 Tax=Trichoplusia ni TaxID=7111 RepID=A0A7E5VUG5_TRINI|nr:aspartyl/asparaginyl beta-hydroxylase isoform X2 [Trichoplusia ni]
MSGDVQPRKRKDKKKKKDDLGVEEPRGTEAALGEGDVFMHSYHDHGTGGHWCAKIIFFSLLAVLITLIGLIILENRGLTELEANSVESRYSGVLEGWLEDAPDDDHHDEHTLELKHHDLEQDHSPEDDHDDEDEEHGDVDDHDDDDDHDLEDHDDEDDDQEGDDDGHDDETDEGDDHDDEDEDVENDDEKDENSEEQNLEDSNEEDDNDVIEQKYDEKSDDLEDDDDDEDNENLQNADDNDDNESAEENDGDDEKDEVDNHSQEDDNDNDDDENDDANDGDNSDEDEQQDENDEEEHEEEAEEDLAVEVERLEKEPSDDDALSEEEPAAEPEDDDKSEEVSNELAPEDEADEVSEDEEFLEPDDIEEDLPEVEPIVVPQGKPLDEVEDEPSTIKPADTLAEEEEYEKQQEELRREQEQASHMWLKLVVGGALLVATHAVVRRAIAPRDDTPASDDHASREETPVIDRRMTLIPEERAAAASPREIIEEIVEPIEEKIIEKVSSVIKSSPPQNEEVEEEEEEENEDEEIIEAKNVQQEQAKDETEEKELYSDEEEAEEEEEEIEEIPLASKPAPAAHKVEPPKPEADEDVPDDVEIIDEEQIEEELEEEEDDEEEISDVDDAELLSRLEAKYGRLPEPERPGPKHKDGGNSIEDDWPGEPSNEYWREELDKAEQELRQGDWRAASHRVSAEQLRGSGRARWLLARALDAEAEARRDNRLLTRAIAAYLDVLKMNERLADARLLEVADKTLERIRFRGNYLSAEPVYRLLIRRFPDVPHYYNNLTISFLMANRADLAELVLEETLQKWPNDRIALAHHGFVLKTQHKRYEEAVEAFLKALEGDEGPATEPRFYYHLGDSLLLLGRFTEAHEVHKRGAALGHFLSPAQRSLYNVDRLKSQPWWDIEKTPYNKLARALEKSWKDILKEGEKAKALYEKEKEGLKERGEWSQLDLFVRGQEIPNRCKTAPVTCSIVRSEVAASGCRRGQVKFSAMEAGTHVRPHVGPTNCRLRMHLGLSNTKDTYIRVDQETRQWEVGKTLLFDDSFEHEVWHNGTGTRLVLIVDVWHPALTAAERRTLPPI